MNKKGIGTIAAALVGLILLLIVLGSISFFIVKNVQPTIERTAQIQIVRQWVSETAAWNKATGGFAPASFPPIPNLGEPIEVKSEDQLKNIESKDYINKNIAGAMLDCSSAFGYGEIDFLSNLGDEVFCYPCTSIHFDEKLKSQGYSILGLYDYMNETKVATGNNQKTYLQALNQDKKVDLSDFSEEVKLLKSNTINNIPIQSDLHIFYVAYTNKYLETLQNRVSSGGAIAGGGTILVCLFTGVGFVPCAIATTLIGAAGIGGGAVLEIAEDKQIYSGVILGDAKYINSFCATQTQEEEQSLGIDLRYKDIDPGDIIY